MDYSEKTLVIFDTENDSRWYKLMLLWNRRYAYNFDFYDLGFLVETMQSASRHQFMRRARERMRPARQVIVLVGDRTAEDYTFVQWQIEVAIELDKPIIAVNIDKNPKANPKTPPVLFERAYFVTVPFTVKLVHYALSSFPYEYLRRKHEAPSARHYI